jgi:hypothetical protein
MEALQNAVLNSALQIEIDENIQMILLRYIDNLTPLHLKMLALFENPRAYMQKVNRPFLTNIISTSLDGMIQYAIPEFHRKHEDIRIVFQDLYNYGLLNTRSDTLGVGMSASDSGIFAQRTTDMAEFSFVTFLRLEN